MAVASGQVPVKHDYGVPGHRQGGISIRSRDGVHRETLSGFYFPERSGPGARSVRADGGGPAPTSRGALPPDQLSRQPQAGGREAS